MEPLGPIDPRHQAERVIGWYLLDRATFTHHREYARWVERQSGRKPKRGIAKAVETIRAAKPLVAADPARTRSSVTLRRQAMRPVSDRRRRR